MICKDQNLDFFKIREIMKDGYKRNAHIPMSGFAGPCLLKDTMQLSSFYNKKIFIRSFCYGCKRRYAKIYL